MNRIDRAIQQLWGPLSENDRFGPEPAFMATLSQRTTLDLQLQSSDVSKWSLGKQLEHLYLSSHYVIDRVEECLTGANSSSHMGPYGFGLMVGGFIPRGVFPTIPPLVPKSGTLDDIEPLKASLKSRIDSIYWDLTLIKSSCGKSRHPRMKYLTAAQWLYFAEIHHRHHLSIIHDIKKLASGERSSNRALSGTIDTKSV